MNSGIDREYWFSVWNDIADTFDDEPLDGDETAQIAKEFLDVLNEINGND